MGHTVVGARRDDDGTLKKGPLVDFERITINPDIMGGVPCIRGLRIPVATVVTMVAEGMTTDDILADLPDLETEDIREALRYAAETMQEGHLPLKT